MNTKEEAPLSVAQRRLQGAVHEAILFFFRKRTDLYERGVADEITLAAAAYHRLLHQCGDDESVVALILQKELELMKEEYKPVEQEVRRRIRGNKKLIGI